MIKIFKFIFCFLFNSVDKGIDLFNPSLYSKKFRVLNEIEGKKSTRGNLWAILVLYEKAEIPFYVKNIIKVLNDLNINILISVNDSINSESLKYLEDNCKKLLVRKNFGRDFSAYKDALTYLNLKNIDKLILLNTSIVYFKKNLQKTMAHFINNEYDIISLYKNFNKKEHYQSFLFSFSNKVITDKKFIHFWKTYTPFNNRTHAIKNGEIKLSTKVLNFYRNYYIVNKFSSSEDFICFDNVDDKTFVTLLPDGEKKFYYSSSPLIKKNDYSWQHYFSNHSHSYAFLSYFKNKSLILKKDIYIRGTYSIPSISFNLKTLDIDKLETDLFMQLLLNQKHHNQLEFFQRTLFLLGLR